MKTLQDEAERFFNENYSGTKTSDFLKPYIINTYKAASQFREPSSPDKIDEAISYFEEIKSERESKKEDDTVLINYVLIILKSIKQRSPTVKEGTEPIAMKAGDLRVMVNGEPVAVDFRIISEELYQKLTRKPLDR